MKSMLAIVAKDLKLLLHNRGDLFFTFVYPILFALFFGMIFGSSGEDVHALKTDAVDGDRTDASRSFLTRLANAPELEVTLTDSLTARRDVLSGRRMAYIYIKKGFGEARENPFWGQPPQLELGLDPSRKAEAGMLKGILMKYAVQDLQNVFSDTLRMKQSVKTALHAIERESDLPERQKGALVNLLKAVDDFYSDSVADVSLAKSSDFKGFEPLEINEKRLTAANETKINSFALTFPQGIVWGMLACAISFAVSLVGERTRGTLFRIQAASVSKYSVLGGKALSSFLVSLFMAIGLLGIGVVGFGVKVHSYLMLGIALMAVSASFVGLMVLFSVLGKNERTVGGVSWMLGLPLAMIGGGMIPLAFMPEWLQKLSVISPFKWAVLSIEGGLWRAFTWSQLILPLLILSLMGGGTFLLGTLRFRWEN